MYVRNSFFIKKPKIYISYNMTLFYFYRNNKKYYYIQNLY